jgi:hypothetical protein
VKLVYKGRTCIGFCEERNQNPNRERLVMYLPETSQQVLNHLSVREPNNRTSDHDWPEEDDAHVCANCVGAKRDYNVGVLLNEWMRALRM